MSDPQSFIFLTRYLSVPAPKGSLGLWTNWQIHDSIKPTKKKIDKVKFTMPSKPLLHEFESKQALAFPQKTTQGGNRHR
jgi:hypothetical protein